MWLNRWSPGKTPNSLFKWLHKEKLVRERLKTNFPIYSPNFCLGSLYHYIICAIWKEIMRKKNILIFWFLFPMEWESFMTFPSCLVLESWSSWASWTGRAHWLLHENMEDWGVHCNSFALFEMEATSKLLRSNHKGDAKASNSGMSVYQIQEQKMRLGWRWVSVGGGWAHKSKRPGTCWLAGIPGLWGLV